MRNHGVRRLESSTIALIVALTLPLTSLAQAQTASSDGQAASALDGVDEIVVTAQKRTESINDVGMSITALSGDEMKAQGVVDVADLARVVPSFVFTKSSYGAPVYTLRGVGFYETGLGASPAVSVYQDEVVVPFPVMASGVGLDLERVEVLKGPQGTLFGQNSTGGAINYIAAKPTSTFQAGADFSYSRFDHIEAEGFVSGPLSDTLRARLALRSDHMGDWQKSYTRADEIGETDIDIARLLLDWTPTDRLTFLVNVNGWRERSDNQAGQLIAIGGTTGPLPPELINYPRAPHSARTADWTPGTDFYRDQDYFQVSVRGDYEINDELTLTSLSSYQKLDRKNLSDTDAMSFVNFHIDNDGEIRSHDQELRIAGDFGAVRPLLGVNYSSTKVFDELRSITVVAHFPFDGAGGYGKQRAETWAVFGGVDWSLSDKLTLQASVRYTDQARRFNACGAIDSGAGDLSATLSALATRLRGNPVTIPAGACATLGPDFLPGEYDGRLKEDNIAWRVGLEYNLTPDQLFYANVSRGYKNGSFPVLGATFQSQYEPATQERLTAYETGFKLGLFDRIMQLNGAAFYYDYKDKQVRGSVVDLVVGRLNRLINVPTSRVYGWELELQARPMSGLNLSLAGSMVDTKITGNFTNVDALAVTQLLSGESFPLVPKWNVSGAVDYRVPISSVLDLTLGANASYRSKTNSGLGEQPLLYIKDYALVDARIGVTSNDDRWRVGLFAQNLTNTYYWTFTNAASPNPRFRYAGMPRVIGVNAGVRF